MNGDSPSCCRQTLPQAFAHALRYTSSTILRCHPCARFRDVPFDDAATAQRITGPTGRGVLLECPTLGISTSDLGTAPVRELSAATEGAPSPSRHKAHDRSPAESLKGYQPASRIE